MRRHGWQRPLHPLQIVGMSVFILLVAAFYCFLGLFLGSAIAEITVTTVFSFAALSASFLFIRCTAIDPTDKTRYRFRRRKKTTVKARTISSNLKFGFFALGHLLARVFRRVERKILRTFIRRKYLLLDHQQPSVPLLPFHLLVLRDDDSASVAPHPKELDLSFCALCDFEVQKHSKHCRTCNRCVEGFDHHCRWLNNCVGKKNYTTFILLMVFVLIMLIVEGGTAIAIFIRCFADQEGIEIELNRRHYLKFPRGVLAVISVLLVMMTAYSSIALGQLFFFHMLLIRKGMRTYDYILAMKEENQFMEVESGEDSDFSSDESTDSSSPEKPSFMSRVTCSEGGINQNPEKLTITIDRQAGASTTNEKQGFRASINPWKLITMSQEKAILAANRAKERLMKQKTMTQHDPLEPLPLETKSGPSIKPEKSIGSNMGTGLTPLILKETIPGSPGKFSSPRRRISCSPTIPSAIMGSPKQRYRSNFDLQLTQVSSELETYISRQVLSSILRKDGNRISPK
ncbi:unnamed protein product [Coffea canephora]|uniref:S-acyltransferase n=1 Tax=Coffea canephora TaxID=49390 RepID=A0A068V8R2_COFCA|nr:unnamed protein product [Coffea canephora]